MQSITVTAPVNIAVVKYWGKRDEKLILPINSSLSATLDGSVMRAKTTISTSPDFTEDSVWLNGTKEQVNGRTKSLLDLVRKELKDDKNTTKSSSWKIHIVSENNFPTAAGLASSAAGYAALAFGLKKLYHLEMDVSILARQGSGSACRSVYGGFVAWDSGVRSNGEDSKARVVATADHWPEIRVVILVVSAGKKHTGSTTGMQKSVETSSLLKHRAEILVPKTMVAMETAIRNRDFDSFAELTMQDSNQMHACCLDTFPPISYMTDTSRDIQYLVHYTNDFYGVNKVGYTFDAGPNACLYVQEKDLSTILGIFTHYFPPKTGSSADYVTGLPSRSTAPSKEFINGCKQQPEEGALQFIINTKVGEGPKVLA